MAVIPKPLWTYRNAKNMPAINRAAKAYCTVGESKMDKNDSSPIKWNKENKIAEKITA